MFKNERPYHPQFSMSQFNMFKFTTRIFVNLHLIYGQIRFKKTVTSRS